jgi:hypothetical protein
MCSPGHLGRTLRSSPVASAARAAIARPALGGGDTGRFRELLPKVHFATRNRRK